MSKRIVGAALATLAVAGAIACGGSSSSSPAAGHPTAAGRFIDGPVGGLHFTSGSTSGTTAADGSFTYEVGQPVTFTLGGITFGTVNGKGIVTPVDLVPTANPVVPESDPKVLRIAQLLLTVDADGDPSNGISVPAAVQAAAAGKTFDFTSSEGALATFLSGSLGVSTPLVTAAVAQAHLRASILGLYVGTWSGTYGSGSTTLGTWTLTISANGVMSGSFVDNADGPGTLNGTLYANSTFLLGTSNSGSATGIVDPAEGSFSGALVTGSGTGWFRGTRG